MLDQEYIYKLIINKEWNVILKILYEKRGEINSDLLLQRAASIFESEFLKAVNEGLLAPDLVKNLEDLFILHSGKFYLLSDQNYRSLALELARRKSLPEAYNYAMLFPDEPVNQDIISEYRKTVEDKRELTDISTPGSWITVYNQLFKLINDQNDTATYFSGARFLSTVREFLPYFYDYQQYIDFRNSEGKSTSRKIYYYDVLYDLPDGIRSNVISRILEINRPFKPIEVLAIEEQLGKTPKTVTINFRDTLNATSDEFSDKPVVFISYSWDSENHKEWVLNLANRLRDDGIDVILDRYYLTLGKNLPHFVETSIARATRIIIVFTPNYKLKADGRSGGVGYEYSIMNADLYANQTTNEKVIPVLRTGDMEESIPKFMQQFIHLDIRNDLNFENSYIDLRREIYNEPTIVMPKLGRRPLVDDGK